MHSPDKQQSRKKKVGEKLRRLQIRTRQTLDGDASTASNLSVYCPIRRETMDLDECITCERCHSFSVDPSGRDSFMICDGACGDELATVETLPDADPVPARRNAEKQPISSLLSGEVICVRPSLSIEALAALFLERGISGVPVVDEAGFPIGMVSKTDLLQHAHDQGDTQEHSTVEVRGAGGWSVELGPGFHVDRITRGTVSEIMMPMTMSLPESAPVAQAAALMAYEGVHRIPVVSDTGTVVGVVSTIDVLRLVATQSGYSVPGRTRKQRPQDA